MTIISVEGLSKQYAIGALRNTHRTLRETLAEEAGTFWSRLRSGGRRGGVDETLIWALDDISFQVREGEAVGIIGKNGAGKSTLLKILSRITEPTRGRAVLWGRVASLLEVGTGFHQDLTGRENIFLNGAILGMSRAELHRKLDEIVAFAELEQFVDTVVKHYSTGMYMRLAFAVAAHLEPEILIVDEVLAVGDLAFQRKCIGRMKEVTGEGRTVLFVSHNLGAVESLCNRALLLESGKLVMDGRSSDVAKAYAHGESAPQPVRRWSLLDAPGDGGVVLRSATVRRLDRSSDTITVRTPIVVEFEFEVRREGLYHLSLHFLDEHGLLIFNSFPPDLESCGGLLGAGIYRTSCVIPGDFLNAGIIRVDVIAVRDRTVVLFREDAILRFEVGDVPDHRGGWWGEWRGAVRPILRWSTQPSDRSKSELEEESSG